MKILISILLIAIGQNLFAYPITPRPLRKLVIESKLIVYADVIDIKEEEESGESKAILVIKEKLQGKFKKDTIEVYFSPGMICPSPANYEKGTSVLAFLDKHKKSYYTHALSYGSKKMNANTFKSYKSRIIEIQDILKIRNKKRKVEKTIDWLVRCAIDPNTRREGVYELSPKSDFMSYYDQDKETFISKYKLNDLQKSKLKDAFFKTEGLNYSDLGIIDLIISEKDTEVINFLMTKLKGSNLDEIWYKGFVMRKIAAFTNREDLIKIVDEFNKISYMDKNRDQKMNKLTKDFINTF